MTMPNGGALPAMPAGMGTSSASNPGTDTPAVAPPNTANGGWSPPFQFGKGKSGVFTDPREQIAGGTSGDIQASATTPGQTGSPAAGNVGGSGALNGGGDSANASPLPSAPNKLNLPGTIEQQIQEGMNR